MRWISDLKWAKNKNLLYLNECGIRIRQVQLEDMQTNHVKFINEKVELPYSLFVRRCVH